MGYQKYITAIYKKIKENVKEPDANDLREIVLKRKKAWRTEDAVTRVERPTRIDRARKYGYKAKQGFVVARARVRRGGARKQRPVSGRGPSNMGILKITRAKSIQRIAEERTQKRFPILEVLESYWLWEDGQFKWFEVVLADPNHPAIQNDRDVSWIASPQHTRRVFRGLTPAGKKGRGLTCKGKGAEKLRPSRRANRLRRQK